jgi:hypothetical protein
MKENSGIDLDFLLKMFNSLPILSLETLDIWYPIVSPITLIGLPGTRYLRASFTYISAGMARDLRVGLHNCGSIRLVMNWTFSPINFCCLNFIHWIKLTHQFWPDKYLIIG